jgi:KDO2-lipid IV(A) lauroyltransferase
MIGRSSLSDRFLSWIALGLLRVALRMPYMLRIRFVGWTISRVFGPLAGLNKRIRKNLALVMPELSEAEVRRLCLAVTNNMGRTFIESYSHGEFLRLCADLPPEGPGWEVVVAARKANKPVVFFTGHLGNYAAPRATLLSRDYPVGVLYRPLSNRFFEPFHRAAIEKLGPTFARGSAGLGEMVRHLKQGNSIAFTADQHVYEGASLRFFGLPAATATSAARLAIKYEAILVPVYGIRRPDGFRFDLVFETPVPPCEPEAMTQALNDSLEAMIRKHPEQWMWTHRRWKLAEQLNQPPNW